MTGETDYEDIDPSRPRPLYHDGRFVCRPETPCALGSAGSVVHPQAEMIRAGDYSDTYRCPVCGHTFDVELPE
jgi:hypothetical protein